MFWKPDKEENVVSLSWGGSGGDFSKLWEHSQNRWNGVKANLARLNIAPPSGRIVEFGTGMGLLDDLIEDKNAVILMLDHTQAYIKERSKSLSARCRLVLWTPDNLETLCSEPGSYDWLISIAVFYHVEDITAAALILELGKLLKPGGYVLIQGWNRSTPEEIRQRANKERLFSRYPNYLLNLDLLKSALAPDYRELSRQDLLLYQKLPIELQTQPSVPEKSSR